MIVFTDPRGWWLLGLAGALTLLALLRWRRRSVALNAFFLLRRAVADLAALPAGLRRRRQLSLLLTAAAMALLALAGFRPLLLADAPELRELIIIDRSPSLGVRDGGRERAARIRGLLGEYLDAIQPEDTVHAVVAGPRAAVSPRLRGAAAVRGWLGESAPADAAADVPGAIAQAGAIAAREAPTHVVLFTDRPARWTQEPGWARLAALRPSVVSVGAARENGGITAFDLRRDPGREGRYDLYVGLARHAPEPGGERRRHAVRVENNGRTVATADRELAPGESAEVLLRGLELEHGRVEVALDPPDDWEPDNRVLAGIAGRGGVRVVLAARDSPFLRDALAADRAVDLREPGEDGTVPASAGAVHVYDGIVPEGPLPERALFVMPNRALQGVAPSGVLPPPDRIEGDESDPLLRGVNLDHISVRGHLTFDLTGECREVLTGDGRPLLLLVEDGWRRWAILGFDPSQTDFVYTASYPVLIANLVTWLSLLTSGERAFFVAGEDVLLPAAAAGGSVALPQGRKVALPREAIPAPFSGAERAGRYRVAGPDGAALGEFYVNVTDPAVTADMARPGYGGGSGVLPAGVRRPRLRRPLAPWLALGALALLALEVALRPPAVSGRS